MHSPPTLRLERVRLANRSKQDSRQDFNWETVSTFGLGDSTMACAARLKTLLSNYIIEDDLLRGVIIVAQHQTSDCNSI